VRQEGPAKIQGGKNGIYQG